jgi:hypothetical protein
MGIGFSPLCADAAVQVNPLLSLPKGWKSQINSELPDFKR